MKHIQGNYFAYVKEFQSAHGSHMWSIHNNVSNRGKGGFCESENDGWKKAVAEIKQDDAASFFMVVEGMEGVGKSTLTQRLTIWLQQWNQIVKTEEPNADCVANSYIRQVLSRQVQVSNYALALAYALNRIDHVNSVITPALTQRQVVICDRYLLSSLVYQSRDGLSADAVFELNREAIKPDLTLYLNTTPEIAERRVAQRNATPEKFDRELHMLRSKYDVGVDYLGDKGHNIEEINAANTSDQVLLSALHLVSRYAPLWVKTGV